MISGKTVPSRTTKAKIANTTLLARNAPSRDGRVDHAGRPQPVATPGDHHQRHHDDQRQEAEQVAVDLTGEKECTLPITPERVRNVPRIVDANVATSRLRFHTRDVPRRCCTDQSG